MPETSILEDTVTRVGALYEAICRQADEDAFRSDEENALIARIGEKLAELQARVRAGREKAPGPVGTAEGASPEQEQWERWVHVARKIARLSEDLYGIEHPMADALGAAMDKVAAAEAKGDYALATKLLTGETIGLVETHDLWAAVEPAAEDDPANLLPESTRAQIARLRDLERVLTACGHPDVEDFSALVDRIPDAVTEPTALMPAARAVEDAWAFADAQGLWEMRARADAEAAFWEANGDRYRRLQNLLRSLSDARRDSAPEVKERLAEVDRQIADESFHQAGVLIDETWDFARDRGIIEEGPKDIWQGLSEDVAALEALSSAAQVQHGLRDKGFPDAATLARFVKAMQAAAAALDWQQALDQYEAGKAFADAQGLWDELCVEAPEVAETPAADEGRDAWEKWAFLHEKMRDLCTRLADRGHPLADRLGAYLDEVDEALGKAEYRRATDLLVNEAGDFAADHDLWQIAEAGEGENLLPAPTQRQIVRLADLSRELTAMGHDKAAEFDRMVSDIPRVVTEFPDLIPAGRAVERAWTYADDNALWSAVPALTKAEEERLFWETGGKLYRDLNALLRRLEEAGHADAGALSDEIAAVDREVGQASFVAAGLHLDAAREMADDRALWDAVPADDTGAGDNALSATIGGSVGRSGKNDPADVLTVQVLLNRDGAGLAEDGDCGPATVRAIEAFQKAAFGVADGRVDPDGRTMAALTGRQAMAQAADAATETAGKVAKTVAKAAGAAVEAVDDALGAVGDLLGGFFGGNDRPNA